MPRARFPGRRLCAAAAVAAAGGCASYEARPLTPAAVDRALTPPAPAEVEAQAAAVARTWPTPIDWSAAGLSPDRAAVLAVVLNPTLRAERRRRDLAQAQLVQAGILPNPQVSFGLLAPVGMNSINEVVGLDVGLSWEITSLIGHDADVRSARAAADQIQHDVAWREWQVAEEARMAALNLGALEAQLALRRELESGWAQRLDAVRAAVERGQSTIAELSVTEAAARQAGIDTLTAQASAAGQLLTLRRTMGMPPDAAIGSPPPPPAHVNLPDPAALIENLEQRRLDLVALRAGYESQEEKLRAAVLRQFPRISIGPTGTRDTGNFYTVGFGVTVDVPLFDRNQGQIAIERATREQLFDEYVARVFDARADVASALDTDASLATQIDAANDAIPALERLAATYRDALRRGETDALTAYAAESAVVQKRVDLLELLRQRATNVVSLELAAGVFVPLDSPSAHAAADTDTAGGPRP